MTKYDPQKAHDYYVANRERIIARVVEREANLPPAAKAKRRAYKTAKQREYDMTPKGQARLSRARQWYLDNPDAYWVHGLKRSHGMRPEQWYAMWEEQQGNCYLCTQPLPKERRSVAIDHDHSHCPSGRSCAHCRRGLAHSNCNTAIGLLGDDPAILRLVAERLEQAKAVIATSLLAAPTQVALFDDVG